MSGARRAALLLASLTRADRDDVLSRLSLEQRERLAVYLDELQALGVAPGHDWLAMLEPDRARKAPKEPAAQAMQVLETADAELIGRALAREPVALIAALLSLRDWPWHDRFLAACSADRRDALARRLQARVVLANPVRQLLVEKIARRVSESDPAARPGAAFEAALAEHGGELPRHGGWRPAWAR